MTQPGQNKLLKLINIIPIKDEMARKIFVGIGAQTQDLALQFFIAASDSSVLRFSGWSKILRPSIAAER